MFSRPTLVCDHYNFSIASRMQTTGLTAYLVHILSTRDDVYNLQETPQYQQTDKLCIADV
jgi:hypothetical protein